MFLVEGNVKGDILTLLISKEAIIVISQYTLFFEPFS
jgi:hypothetical protein